MFIFRLIIHISYDTQYPLGIKYGCDPLTEAPSLMELAYNLGLSVVGVSFHVDSKCNKPAVFKRAIANSANIFQLAQELGFKNMHLLNIGGGFDGNKNASLDNVYILNILLKKCILNYFFEHIF